MPAASHFLTGKIEDDVAAMDQRGQNHAQELRFDAKLRPIVDAGFGRDQFGPIQDLALAPLTQASSTCLA